MKQDMLLDALGAIDISYIDEAAPNGSSGHRRLGVWLSLAACLVMAVSLSTLLLLRLSPQAGTPKSTEAVPQAAANPAAATDSNASLPGASNDNVSPGGAPLADGGNVSRETILAYRFGALYLGMSRDELYALLGFPQAESNSGPEQLSDGTLRVSEFYKLGNDLEKQHDLNVGLADVGNGWVVNRITVYAGNTLALPHGIEIGMTQEELLTAWPEIATEFRYEEDGVRPEDKGLPQNCSYALYAEDGLVFTIALERDEESYHVMAVALGPLYPYPPFDAENDPLTIEEVSWFVGQPIKVYRSENGEWLEIESLVTVWHMENGVWQPVDLTENTVWRMESEVWREVSLADIDHPAKRLETQLSIEELRPLDCATGTPRYLLDFHNLYVVGIFDEDEAGAVYLQPDGGVFASALTTGTVDTEQLGLQPLQYAVFPKGVWALLEELTGS